MVSSTNGDLGPDDGQHEKGVTPIHAQQQPEVEVVEETKYVLTFTIMYLINTVLHYPYCGM